MNKKDFKRKILIVDKDFQIRFVLKFVTITLTGTFLSTGLILTFYYFTYKYGGRDLSRYLIEVGVDPNMPFIPTDRFLLALPVVTLIAGIFMILSFIFGILYSHKLAGPIYRIEKSILQLINGARNFQVKLRKKDEFKKLADTMNNLIGYFQENSYLIKKVRDLLEQYQKTQDPYYLEKSQEMLDHHIEELHS